MGEYDRKQQKQESRTIANCGAGSKQLKHITGNRIIQMGKKCKSTDFIPAGNSGTSPHIHVYKNDTCDGHLFAYNEKYPINDENRANLQTLMRRISENNPRTQSVQQMLNYINRHLAENITLTDQ